MALAATMVFEMRVQGSPTNGGGYKSDAGTTDYSQQDAAQLALTDVVATQAAPTTLTSATGGFTAAMVGNCLYLAGGSGGTITTGWYEIITRVDTNTITIDRTCVPSAATVTAITCNVGGAVYIVNGTTMNVFMGTFTAGNTLYIKAGTYTLTTAPIILTSGGGTTALPVWWIGYNATRGDNPTGATRPLWDMGGYNTEPPDHFCMAYIAFTATSGRGVSTYNYVGGIRVHCRFTNTSTTADRYAGPENINGISISCEYSSLAGYGASYGQSRPGRFINCYFHDSNVGLQGTGGDGRRFIGCLFENCATGIQLDAAGSADMLGNTFVACGTALLVSGAGAQWNILNNIFAHCTTGINWSGGTNYLTNRLDYGNFYGNGTDVINVTKGPNTTAYDPAFKGLRSWTDLVVSAGSNVVITSATGGFSTYFQAGDYIWLGAAADWTSNAYRIVTVDSANQLTLATSPAGVGVTGGIARTIRTAVGVSDARLGDASSCRGAGLGLTLGVGAASTVEQGAWMAGAGAGGGIVGGSLTPEGWTQ